MASNKPAVIVISSHVVRGTVGNRAAAFALEVMGYPVWIVPTVILPWHPGHGIADRITPPATEFDQLMDDITQAPWLDEVGAVLSGYLGNKRQVDAVSRLVRAVKNKNSDAIYALDPVIGDATKSGEGRLYVPEEQADAMREMLVNLADLITPNPFELSWLTQTELPVNQEDLRIAASQLAVPKVLATSAPALMQGHIGNLLVINSDSQHRAYLTEHRFIDGPPNGMGDLAAALMLGNLLNNGNGVEALQKTTASLAEIMVLAAKTGSDELPLEAGLSSIIHPRTPVVARSMLIAKSAT
ncbi:MAG: pyridoxal kinase [Rhizobiaceae bacterium]|nr:pyridoxal kinase [Rhizobiaceae bacterium]